MRVLSASHCIGGHHRRQGHPARATPRAELGFRGQPRHLVYSSAVPQVQIRRVDTGRPTIRCCAPSWRPLRPRDLSIEIPRRRHPLRCAPCDSQNPMSRKLSWHNDSRLHSASRPSKPPLAPRSIPGRFHGPQFRSSSGRTTTQRLSGKVYPLSMQIEWRRKKLRFASE